MEALGLLQKAIHSFLKSSSRSQGVGFLGASILLVINNQQKVIMKNKIYEKPIAFDVDQPVSGVRRYTVYARNEQEAIDKVKHNNLTEHDTEWFEELESDVCYVIDADESDVLEQT
jgi:hypothetical protein